MPQHRRLNLKKFLDSVSHVLLKEYLDRKYAGSLPIHTYDAETVYEFLVAPENELLKSNIREDLRSINDVCEVVMNHLVRVVVHYGIEIRDDEKREELAMRVFLRHREAFEYAYDKFCLYNSGSMMSQHKITAGDFKITQVKLEAFKSRVSRFYSGLAKGQECIIRHYDDEDQTIIVVLHGSYSQSLPTWEGHEIRTLFFRPAAEDILQFDKKARTLCIKAPHKSDKENYLRTFAEVIVEEGAQADRPDLDAAYTLEPLQKRTFSFAGNEVITGISLVEIKLSLAGITSPDLFISSPDVMTTLSDDLAGKISLDSAELTHAKFKFNLRIDGEQRIVTFEISPPNVTNLHKSRYAELIGAYLKENGVKLV